MRKQIAHQTLMHLWYKPTGIEACELFAMLKARHSDIHIVLKRMRENGSVRLKNGYYYPVYY